MDRQLIGVGQFTLTKIPKGLPGESAKYVTISGEQIFKYKDSEMLSIPEPRQISLVAQSFNISSNNIKWYYRRPNSSSWEPVVSPLGKQLTETSTLTVDPNEIYWEKSDLIIFACVVDDKWYDEISIVKLAQGESFSVVLDNETQVIPTDINGNFSQSELESISVEAQVFQGTEKISLASSNDFPSVGEYTIKIDNQKDLDGRIDVETGKIYVTYLSADSNSGSFDIEVTVKTAEQTISGSKLIKKTFKLSKAKQGFDGVPGEDAKQVSLTGINLFTIGADNIAFPSSITLTGVYRNFSSENSKKWERLNEDGSWVEIQNTLGESEISFSDSNFSLLKVYPSSFDLENKKTATIRFNVNGYYDEIGLTRISETTGYLCSLTNDSHLVAADSNGNIYPSEYTNAYTQVEAYKNTIQLEAVLAPSLLSDGKFYSELISIAPDSASNIIAKTDEKTFSLTSIGAEDLSLIGQIRTYFEAQENYQDKFFTVTKSLTGETGAPGEDGENGDILHDGVYDLEERKRIKPYFERLINEHLEIASTVIAVDIDSVKGYYDFFYTIKWETLYSFYLELFENETEEDIAIDPLAFKVAQEEYEGAKAILLLKIQESFGESITEHEIDITQSKTDISIVASRVETVEGVTEEVSKHFKFSENGWVEIYATENGEPGRFKTQITDKELAFSDNGQRIAWLSNEQLFINNAQVTNQLTIGNFVITSSSTGGIIFR